MLYNLFVFIYLYLFIYMMQIVSVQENEFTTTYIQTPAITFRTTYYFE